MIAFASLLVGYLVPQSEALRAGDRTVVAVWMGLLLISVGLLALSFLMPLGNGVAAGFVGALCLTSIALRQTRRSIRALHGKVDPAAAIVVGGLIALTAVVAGTAPADGGSDYALYHYPVTRWLSEYGTVPGLALIHMRFGNTASWWTINSVLDGGQLRGRVAPILGFVSICLVMCHAVLASARVFQRRATRSDRYLLISLAFIGPHLFGFAGGKPFTDSADRPVALLGISIAWLMLAMSEASPQGCSKRSSCDRGSVIALMVLAAGAVTLKLSALPMLAAASLFVLACKAEERARIHAIGIAGLLVGMTMLFNLRVSGCPLYPAGIGCARLPWAIAPEDARAYSEIVTNWARWGTRHAQGTFVEWLPIWIAKQPLLAVSSLISIVAGVPILLISACRHRSFPPLAWPVLLGVLGLIYGILLAPSFRFLGGYVSLIPAAALLLLLERSAPAIRSPFRPNRVGTFVAYGLPALMMLGLIALPTPVFNLGAAWRGQFDRIIYLENVRWLAPPSLRTVPVEVHFTSDVEYWMPLEDGCCYGSPLPCTPYLTYSEIRLRLPERGLAGGFIRADR